MGEAVSVLFVVTVIVGFVVIVRWLLRLPNRVRKPRREREPPTEKQLEFIGDLMDEREAETWMYERDPATVKEASDWIERLLAAPRRESS